MEPSTTKQKAEDGKIRSYENPPNQTLYIRNLNDKVKIDGTAFDLTMVDNQNV